MIENKGATSIRSVTTGVRTHDGREHEFSAYRVQLLGAKESSWVENVGGVPRDFLDGVHESAAVDGFIWWARFTAIDGKRWEVAYDAGSRDTTWDPIDRADQPSSAHAPQTPVLPALEPQILRGRFYPYMYAPSVDSTERALAIRGVIAGRIPRDPEPFLSSDDEQAYEDAVANSFVESWLLNGTSHSRRASPEHWWRAVEPTRSTVVSLLRPRAPMIIDGWTLEGRSSLSIRPSQSIEPPGWAVLTVDAVIRPTSDEPRSRPLALEEFAGLIYTQLTSLLDELAPATFPRVAATDGYEILAIAMVTTASGMSFSDFVALSRSNWGRAEGSYDPSGAEWEPTSFSQIDGPDSRAATVRAWVSKLLRDSGFRGHEADVSRFEMPQLQKPPAT